MATIPGVQNNALAASTTIWTNLATGDTGSPVSTHGKKMTVQVTGTFAGATVTIEGSNDGTNFVSLNDEAVIANPCSFTSAGLKGVLQMPKYIRPNVTAGAGTGLIVTLFNKE